MPKRANQELEQLAARYKKMSDTQLLALAEDGGLAPQSESILASEIRSRGLERGLASDASSNSDLYAGDRRFFRRLGGVGLLLLGVVILFFAVVLFTSHSGWRDTDKDIEKVEVLFSQEVSQYDDKKYDVVRYRGGVEVSRRPATEAETKAYVGLQTSYLYVLKNFFKSIVFIMPYVLAVIPLPLLYFGIRMLRKKN